MNTTNEINDLEENFYLLRVSIGPVQEFISEARKTRDLFMGSRLLSRATWASMGPIFTHLGENALLYPYIPDSSQYNPLLPNIYMVKVPKSKLDNLISCMECALQKFWTDITEKVEKQLPISKEKFNKQIDQPLFYMNWVAIPLTQKELLESYKVKVKNILHFLDERKLTRNFDAWNGDNSIKCNQCGHRESMPSEVISKLQRKNEFKGKFKDFEKLCSICLLKRILQAQDIGLPEPRFESVIDISAATVRESVSNSMIIKEVKDFIDAITKFNSYISNFSKRGECYYKDYLDYEFLKKEYGIEKDPELKKLCTAVQEKQDVLYKKNILGINEPSKYYTIVNMDGDDMGKFMSGEFVTDDVDFTIGYQKELSRILTVTAGNTKTIIEEANGQCIYSGGDDTLAFLPLDQSLDAIRQLRNKFTEVFISIPKPPTSSAGIVILHHRDPLQTGLAACRDNIEKAKEWFNGKDAFFMTVRVFSGAVVTWGSKWTIDGLKVEKENGSVISVLKVLNNLVNFMTAKPEDRLSQRFIRDFLAELPSFYEYNSYDKNKWIFNEMMFKKEFNRLLERHLPKDSKLRSTSIEEIKSILEVFVYMADPDKNESIKKEYRNKVKDNFDHFLKSSLFLVREITGENDDNAHGTH